MSNSSGYQLLGEFCKIKSHSSFTPTANPITPRVQFIMDKLNDMEIPFHQDVYPTPRKFVVDDVEVETNYINLYVPFVSHNQDAPTIVILAHHDVNNPESENCQDNSASVCNLLHLCSLLKTSTLDVNVTVAFVDAEEIVSFQGSGSAILSYRIINQAPEFPYFSNFLYAINLELTGKGSNLWADMRNIGGRAGMKLGSKLGNDLLSLFPNINKVNTPFSDAAVMRSHGLDSICIGILDDENINQLKEGYFCETWSLCHSMEDTYEKISEEDMNYFAETTLMTMVQATLPTQGKLTDNEIGDLLKPIYNSENDREIL